VLVAVSHVLERRRRRCRYLIVLTRLAALIEGLHDPGVDIPALFAEYDAALVG
jgi:hypothetical protein